MGTAGLETAFDERVTLKILQRPHMRHRPLADLRQIRAAAAAVAAVADQSRFDRLGLHAAVGDRMIDAMDVVPAEHLHQRRSASALTASTITPLVSRSKRCTNRTRGGLAGLLPRSRRLGRADLPACKTRATISSIVGCRCLRRAGQCCSSAWRSVVTPGWFLDDDQVGVLIDDLDVFRRLRRRFAARPRPLPRRPACSFRPSSRQRFPLTCTWRFSISRRRPTMARREGTAAGRPPGPSPRASRRDSF